MPPSAGRQAPRPAGARRGAGAIARAIQSGSRCRTLAARRAPAGGETGPKRTRSESAAGRAADEILLSSAGKEVLASGKTYSDAELKKMNFYVQGVEGNIPK